MQSCSCGPNFVPYLDFEVRSCYAAVVSPSIIDSTLSETTGGRVCGDARMSNPTTQRSVNTSDKGSVCAPSYMPDTLPTYTVWTRTPSHSTHDLERYSAQQVTQENVRYPSMPLSSSQDEHTIEVVSPQAQAYQEVAEMQIPSRIATPVPIEITSHPAAVVPTPPKLCFSHPRIIPTAPELYARYYKKVLM